MAKINGGLSARFREWVLCQADAGTIATKAARRRFKDAGHGSIGYSTAGAIMAEICRDRAVVVKAAEAVDRVLSEANPVQVEMFGLFSRAKLVMTVADQVGGLDNLIAMATELKKAGF